jgi:hypothetical protein
VSYAFFGDDTLTPEEMPDTTESLIMEDVRAPKAPTPPVGRPTPTKEQIAKLMAERGKGRPPVPNSATPEPHPYEEAVDAKTGMIVGGVAVGVILLAVLLAGSGKS